MDTDRRQCRICLKVFLNNVTLNQHMNEHFANYTCEQCGKSYATLHRLQTHQDRHKIGIYKCVHCDKVFDTYGKLHSHRVRHRRNNNVCPHCKERFDSFYARQKHLKEEHGDFRPYPCKFCDFVCLTSSKLGYHVRMTHLVRTRSHACMHCDKEFFDAQSLREHLLIHSGKKNHECGVCSRAFLRKKGLMQHMKIHLNIRNYSCSYCGQTFVQKCSLKSHLRTHENATDLKIQMNRMIRTK